MAQNNLESYQALSTLRDGLERELKILAPDLILQAQDAPRVANTSLFSLPGASSETLLIALDLEGIAVSNGSACSSGRVESSTVLKAMGATGDGTVRVSLGWATTPQDIDIFLEAFKKILARVRPPAHA